MSRLHFIILTTLSGVVAFCILLQIILVRVSASDEGRLRQAEQQLQQGQLCFNTWKKVVSRIGEVAQAQNDQGLKDVLTRQGLQIKTNPEPNAPAAAAPAASTH